MLSDAAGNGRVYHTEMLRNRVEGNCLRYGKFECSIGVARKMQNRKGDFGWLPLVDAFRTFWLQPGKEGMALLAEIQQFAPSTYLA